MEPAKRTRTDEGVTSPYKYSNAQVDAFLASGPVHAIVVGSGTGGLTCASVLAQAGKKVLLLERYVKAGGATHSFKEGQFQFEMGLQDIGCEVWLGSHAKESASRLLAAASNDGIRWRHIDTPSVPQHAIIIGNSKPFPVYMPWAKFRAALVERFPLEGANLDRYYAEVQETRALAADFMFSRLPEPSFSNDATKAKHAEGAKKFLAKASHTVDEVLSTMTSNVELKYHLTYLWSKCGLPPNVASWVAHCLTAGSYLNGIAFPVGGSGGIEEGIVPVIFKNGGSVMVEAPVEHVVIENGVCVGVRMQDGRVIRAEHVISNVGVANTYERLVSRDDSALIQAPLNVIRELKWSSYAILQVFMGFEGTAQDLGVPETSFWFLPQNMDHTDNAVKYFLDSTFTSDFPYVHLTFPTAKSQNTQHTTATLFAASHYDWFKDMQPDDIKSVADEIVSRLIEKTFAQFPKLKSAVKFIELATPLAHEFHLGSSRGAPLGLGHTPNRFHQEWLKPQTAVKGLILSGQDVFCCGVANASIGGFMGAASAYPDEVIGKFKGIFE